ncbi:hybrid sensor histidine kinase/response regulator [Paraburkholderia rhynchosiae]|uniref:Virulence sensor protein BvgS n=1 Tax=Paraburkholderia rhynchosiae TaxID=487049 RepID=A0A2N7WN19_9BURK|nr:ATP-binding protein [Paraburkholderia rhynchosiae]PMS30721.1 hybrid sensor histidine kinase/response regulator [Paraburkholderia rhynchosiae]CAB3687211.1 Sensor histidine kinase RcsC [Paraburkholderia rhynchosiae]
MAVKPMGEWWYPLRRFRHSVVLRLLAIAILFSCVLTLLLTALQIHRDYSAGIARIENRLADIDRSYRDSLGEALWRLDEAQLRLELGGIVRLADISVAQVRQSGSGTAPLLISAGKLTSGPAIAREYPLVYRVQGKEQRIGTLYVQATLSDLYHDLTHTALLILATQAANIFLVSLFTIYILTRLVTRHLVVLARTVDSYDFRQPASPLMLNRRPPREPDELERVVTAFNSMGPRLHRAYLDEREAAVEREARRSAEAANRAKGEFLANMSHELRTPLNAILGYAQILRRDASLSERHREGVGVIQRSGDHLLALIGDALDFARIEAGRLRVEMDDVPLAGTLDAIREIIEVKVAQHHVEFIWRVAPDVPDAVRADERRLRQVLLNLLVNAFNFTDHGSVSLLIEMSAAGRVCFEVRDTGIGMDADKLQTIFEPFEQIEQAERGAGGTGLGLTISQQFLRAMGSEIHVQSQPGRGSVFWFELEPASGAPPAPVAADVRMVSGYNGPRRKVLVIDDVAMNRAVMVEFLGRLGFEIVEATGGRQGLAKTLSERPALIVTDIVMADMDGLEATRRLRQIQGFSDVPVIATSASPSGADEQRSLDAGANAFLSKPIDFDQLLAHVARLLHLEWIYAPSDNLAAALDASAAPVFAVPDDELEELHLLARRGDMQEIALWAERVAKQNAQYTLFTARILNLAKGYQSKALLNFVEEHLERKAVP